MRQLGATYHISLPENSTEVGFDGLLADVEMCGNFPVAAPLVDEQHDLPLPLAEVFLCSSITRQRRIVNEHPDLAVVNPNLAGADCLQRLQEEFGAGAGRDHPMQLMAHEESEYLIFVKTGVNQDDLGLTPLRRERLFQGGGVDQNVMRRESIDFDRIVDYHGPIDIMSAS